MQFQGEKQFFLRKKVDVENSFVSFVSRDADKKWQLIKPDAKKKDNIIDYFLNSSYLLNFQDAFSQGIIRIGLPPADLLMDRISL